MEHHKKRNFIIFIKTFVITLFVLGCLLTIVLGIINGGSIMEKDLFGCRGHSVTVPRALYRGAAGTLSWSRFVAIL